MKLGPVDYKIDWEIEGELFEYAVKFAQKMAPNGRRETRLLQIHPGR